MRCDLALEVSVKAGDLRKRLSEITKPITQLYQTWQALPATLRQGFHRLILPVGFVAGQSGTAELGCLFRLIRHFDGDDSTVVRYS